MWAQSVAVLCVVGLAIGQLLFKATAISWTKSASFFAPRTLILLTTAMILYAVTSIAWIWVLQKIDLGRAYTLMAMAFVLVPAGSYFIFGERFQPQYFFGVGLIVLGIVVTART